MYLAKALIITALLTTTTNAATFEADKQATLKQQAELDQACEAARTVKLAPLRQQIFAECMQANRSTSSAEECNRQSAGYNGNRFGASPQFYDLPACEKAFEFKKNNPVND